MKTLHASAIAKLVAKKQITDAVDLLTLIGPDTDLVILLDEIRNLRGIACKVACNPWHNDTDTLDKMLAALFNAASLHYPDQAEQHLRSIRSEYELSSLVSGRQSLSSTDSTIADALDTYKKDNGISVPEKSEEDEDDDDEDDDDRNVRGILDDQRDKLLGKIAYDTYVPGLKQFFSGIHDVYVCGANDGLAPFSHILKGEHILGAHIEKEEDRDEDYAEPMCATADAPQSDTISIMNRACKKRVKDGFKDAVDKDGKAVKKQQYKWIDKPGAPLYSLEPVKKFFQQLSKIDTIIVTSKYDEDDDQDDKRVEKVQYPEFTLSISLRPSKFLTKVEADEDGMLYAITSLRVDIPVCMKNGYYQPIIPDMATQKNHGGDEQLYMRITKKDRNDKRFIGGFYSVYNSYYTEDYRTATTALLRKLVAEGGADFKVKAPKLIGILNDAPLLKQVLASYDAKQAETSAPAAEPGTEVSDVPAAPDGPKV